MPKMITGEVEMVSVEWIMNNATNSVDGYNDSVGVDYVEMMQSKARDAYFPALVSVIMEEGFRIPIVLVKNYSGHAVTHGNGHHRMIAAILLGLDSIPVYWSDWLESGDYMCMRVSDEGLNYRRRGEEGVVDYEDIESMLV